ncbi:MAG: hypothetical protein RBQ71_06180 [Acholeplasmataceae bacterium]|jgi:hypothetical protein|nr:hypothetical protein [Acholeplasmataceae bacterium]
MKKIISVLSIFAILLLSLSINVSASTNDDFFTTQQGILLSKTDFDKLSTIGFSDEMINTMSINRVQHYLAKNYTKFITESKTIVDGIIIKQDEIINVRTIIDSDSVSNYSKNHLYTIAKELVLSNVYNCTTGDYCDVLDYVSTGMTTLEHTIALDMDGTTGNIVTELTWNSMPSTREFDLISFSIPSSFQILDETIYGHQYYTKGGTSSTIDYDYSELGTPYFNIDDQNVIMKANLVNNALFSPVTALRIDLTAEFQLTQASLTQIRDLDLYRIRFISDYYHAIKVISTSYSVSAMAGFGTVGPEAGASISITATFVSKFDDGREVNSQIIINN